MTELTVTKKLVEDFLEEQGEFFSAGYRNNLEIVFYNILLPNLSRDNNLTPAMISKAVTTIIKHGKNKGKEITLTTKITRLGYVKIYLNWLLGEEHIDVLKFSKHTRRLAEKVPQEEPRIIDPDIVRSMVGELSINYRFLIWVGLKTTGRRESLTTLNLDSYVFVPLIKAEKWFNDDTFERLLKKYQPEQEITEITREDKWHGKNKKKITVPLDIEETITFKEYLEIRREEELTYIKRYANTRSAKYQKYRDKIITDKETKEQFFFVDKLGHYLFWNRDGLRMNPRTVSNTINNTATKINVDFQTHDTRRRRIQELYAMGIREESIKKISGHSEKSDTIKRYYDPQKVTVYSEIFDKKLDEK